jgi:hypothetical protein
MVAIMSVLMVLILVTTIGFGAFLNVFAANKDDKENSGNKEKKQTEAVKEEEKDSEGSSKKESADTEKTEKKSTEKDSEKDSDRFFCNLRDNIVSVVSLYDIQWNNKYICVYYFNVFNW